MDASEILKKVRKIEIKTKGLSKHIFSGEYHSAFKGRGMSFSEVRDYHYGDDVRNIDWNVTARTGTPFIKVFEEERELTVVFLIDLSKSAYFGTNTQFKNEIMTEISAVVAFSAMNNNDKVGAIFFTDRIEKFIPPKKGKKHILRIIRELIYSEPEGNGTDIGLALRYLNNVQKKRSIAFLFSDFMTKGYESALSIAGRKHDIIGMHLYDEKEERLPKVGLLSVEDAETGKVIEIDTNDKRVREKYESWFSENIQYLKTNFSQNGLDTLSLTTEGDYVKALLKFFKRRGR
jgi:uncharacterized protein (DUF58 family)